MQTRYGAFAEKAVEKWLLGEGFNVFIDPNNNSQIDIVAEINGHLFPIQVKSTSVKDSEHTVRFKACRGNGISYSTQLIFVFFYMDDNGQEYIGCDIPEGTSYQMTIGVNSGNNIENILLTKERLFELKEKLDNDLSISYIEEDIDQ
jgi:hypothetical protein